MKTVLSVPIIGKVFLILAVLALAAFAGIHRLDRINTEMEGELTALIDQDAVGIAWLARARATAVNVGRMAFEVMVEPSGFKARQTAARLREQQMVFATRMNEAERYLPALAGEFKGVRTTFERVAQRADTLTSDKLAQPDGPPGEAVRDAGRAVSQAIDEFDEMMTRLIDSTQERARERSRVVGEQARTASDTAMLTVGGALAAIFVFAFVLLRHSVVRPLRMLVGTAKDLLAGRLDQTVGGTARGDEIGDVARTIQLLKDTLLASDALSRGTVGAAEQVAAATNQAAAAVEQVSDGSQRQMQSVESITGSVSRTTAIIGTIASVSLTAKDRSREAATRLGTGLKQIEAMTAAVQEIAVTAARINSITQSIGELATRSNILSLNAAIEAARAGEHGRGFSVVAEEVGNLAQQTANLAHEIALLAADSGERIQNGVSIATDVSGLMHTVAAAINETDSLSEDIAQSMEEQGAVLRQIEQSLQRLTEISNANATASEEIAATMVELTRLADRTREQADSVRRGTGAAS